MEGIEPQMTGTSKVSSRRRRLHALLDYGLGHSDTLAWHIEELLMKSAPVSRRQAIFEHFNNCMELRKSMPVYKGTVLVSGIASSYRAYLMRAIALRKQENGNGPLRQARRPHAGFPQTGQR